MNFEREDGKQRLGRDRQSTESGEDYLVRIFELIEEKGYARVADVAESLSVTEAGAFWLRSRMSEEGTCPCFYRWGPLFALLGFGESNQAALSSLYR